MKTPPRRRCLFPHEARFWPIEESPLKGIMVLKSRLNLAYIIFSPSSQGSKENGYVPGRWYYQDSKDWTPGPQSPPFATEAEATLAAYLC